MTDSYSEIFADVQRVLVVFSHPDDAEIYAGGTIARLTKDGKRVRVVKMTSGNKGSRDQLISEEDLAYQREQEDAAAMEVLGVKPEDNIYLHLGDGEVEADLETIGLLAQQIRTFKPDVILTHNPEEVIIRFSKGVNYINHRDHQNTGKAATYAAYPYSRDVLFFPEHFEEDGVESHTTTKFLYVDYHNHEDLVYIDVTDTAEARTRAIASHASQYSLENAQDSTDFFAPGLDGKRFEHFRLVEAD